jgi:tyrosine-protein kinase Etk/Wzc
MTMPNVYPQNGYPQPYDNNPGENDNEIQRYIGFFISNWYWFIFTLFCAITIAYGINNYSERVYTVSSSLLIKDDKNNSSLPSAESLIPGGDLFRNQQNLQNEIGILRSYSLNLRVMEELKDFHVTYIGVGRRNIAEKRMYYDCPIILSYNSLQNQRTGTPITIRIVSNDEYQLEINGDIIGKTRKFGDRFNELGFDFTAGLRDPQRYVYKSDVINKFKVWFESPENLANSYRGQLNIQPIEKDATLITLSITGNEPNQISEYLNKLMKVYIAQGIEEKNRTADSTLKFIDKQLKIISDSLRIAEDKLESFRLNNKLIDVSSEGTLIKNRLEKFENEKNTIQMQLQYYEYLKDYIRTRNESGDIISPSVMSVVDPVLVKLVDALASLQLQRKLLLYNFSENQPSIRLAEAKIDDSRKALEENIKNSVKIVEQNLIDVNERIAVVNTSINKLPGTERSLINFQRKFDLNNTVYTYMLEKRSEAGIAKASNVSNNRIVDLADPYNSAVIRPRVNRNYVLAFILGLVIPAVYIFLTDQLNSKIIDKKDVEKRTTVPVLGFIGHSSYKNSLPVFANPGSSLSESFRAIRTNLKYYFKAEEKKAIISITSTISGEGKTFISTNLAAMFALLGRKTLVIGLDLRKPKIHKIFSASNSSGVSTFLIGENEFDEIIFPTEIKNLFIAPSGPVPPNPAELIESERMRQFMSLAVERFDYIIFDTPPLGIVTDAKLLSSFADLNLFIVRQRYSSKSTLDFIQEVSGKKEIKNPAIVINDINVSGYYGYGLRYGTGMYAGYGYDYGYGRYGSYNYGKEGNYYIDD